MANPLDASFIESLLEKSSTKTYDIPEQFGPLRHFDREMRCASRGCGSSTYYKLQGIPYCMTHSLRTMNEMLINLGVDK